MSSLDSVLNSLSAATVHDFILRRGTKPQNLLRTGKITTLIWGLCITAFAFVVGEISDTVIESINKIGSVFYGPILAAFLAGVCTRRVGSGAIFAGILGGVGFNLSCWVLLPETNWMWWNVFGCLIALVIALIVSLWYGKAVIEGVLPTLSWAELKSEIRTWRAAYIVLILFFVIILASLFTIAYFLPGPTTVN